MKAFITALTCLLLLSGCASSIYQADINKVEEIPVDHGFVGVSVVNNVRVLAPLHPDWSEVLIVRLDNRKKKHAAAIAEARAKGNTKPDEEIDYDLDFYSLQPIAAGSVTSQSFLGSMPPGDYAIFMLFSFYSDGNMSSTLRMPVGYSTGTFSVATDTFTNLGSIVFQPLLNVESGSFWNRVSSQSAYVTRGKALTDLRRFALESHPKLATRMSAGNELTWNIDAPVSEQIRSDLYQLTRQNGFSDRAHRLHKFSNGAVTGRFGLLHYLDDAYQWHTVSLPTDGQLTTVLEGESEVLVGGEFGALYAAPSMAGPWQPIDALNTRESLVWLGAGKTTNYALTQSAETFYVYRFTDVRAEWQRIHSMKRSRSFWTGADSVLPIITADGGLRILMANTTFTFDPSTHTMTTGKPNKELIRLGDLGNGAVVAVEQSMWDGVGDQLVSIDHGANWKFVQRRLQVMGDRQAAMSLPARLADGHFVTLARDGTKSVNSGNLHIVTSDFETLTSRSKHQFHGATKEYCETLLTQLTHDNTLYFLCSQGRIIRTQDLGENYETVFDVDIGSMQERFDALVDELADENAEEEQL